MIVFYYLIYRAEYLGPVLRHSVVDGKWPEFEKAFFGFDPHKVALMSDDQLEGLMQNDKIIRHWGKIKSTRLNAYMVTEYIEKQGSFAQFVAQWPAMILLVFGLS